MAKPFIAEKNSSMVDPRNVVATALAEACWLGAIVTLPLSVQLMAAGPYSDTKIALTQFYGILMWVCLALAFRDLWPRVLELRLPIALAVGLIAASLASQHFALDPSASTHHRDVASMSPIALLPQIGLFLGVCLFLRTPEQLQRLGIAAIITSFAVGLVALAESFGLVNPDHGKDPLWTIVSFMGSGLSVASYLVFWLPVSVWWLWWQLKKSRTRITAPVLLGALLVLVQLSAIFGANKRGPLVSLLVSAVLAAILLRNKKNSLYWGIRVSIASILLFGALTGLALYGKGNPDFRKTPVLGKLSMVVPVGEGTGDASREKIWEVATDIFTGDIQVMRPDSQPDASLRFRPWLGLGPDSAVLALASGYLMLGRWPSSVLEMSTHNFLLDILLNLGVTGAVLFCAFYVSIFGLGLRQLFGTRCSVLQTLLLGILVTSLVALGISLIWGRGYFIVGIQAGILASFALIAMLGGDGVNPKTRNEPADKLCIALLVAAAGYWTYLCFMFPTTEGLALFFIVSGAIVGFAVTTPSPDRASRGFVSSVSNPSNFAWLCYVGSLVLFSIVASRFSIFPILSGTAGPYVLFTGSKANSLMVACVLLIIWGANAALLSNETWSRQTLCRALRTTGIAGIAALLLFLLLGVLAQKLPLPWLADLTAAQVLLAPIAGLILVGTSSARRCSRPPSRGTVITATVCLLASMYFLVPVATNLRAAVAAGYWKRFNLPYDHALATRMSELAPGSMLYRQLRLQLLDDQIHRAAPYSAAWVKLHEARTELMEEANRHSGFSLNSAHLGRVYLEKREMTQCQAEQQYFLQKASSVLHSALNFMPQNEMALVDLAFVHSMRGENEASNECLKLADAITDPPSVAAQQVNHFGWWAYYYDLALRTHSEPRRTMYAQRALRYIDKHLRKLDTTIRVSAAKSSINPQDLRNKGWLHSARGDMWHALDQPEKAMKDLALAGYFWAFSPTSETFKAAILRSLEKSRPLGVESPVP